MNIWRNNKQLELVMIKKLVQYNKLIGFAPRGVKFPVFAILSTLAYSLIQQIWATTQPVTCKYWKLKKTTANIPSYFRTGTSQRRRFCSTSTVKGETSCWWISRLVIRPSSGTGASPHWCHLLRNGWPICGWCLHSYVTTIIPIMSNT